MDNTYFQTLPNGKRVYDFQKIEDAGFPIVIIISMRGSLGKTYNVKDFLLKKFIENEKQAI
jgi:hypothetical protein